MHNLDRVLTTFDSEHLHMISVLVLVVIRGKVLEESSNDVHIRGGTHDDNLQGNAASATQVPCQDLLQEPDKEIDVQAPFVNFVNDNSTVLAKAWVTQKLLEQRPLREELDLGPTRDLMVEPNRVADQPIGLPFPQRCAGFPRHSMSQCRRRNTPRLRYGNGSADRHLILRPC
ncbi:hypothetical protein TOPH_04952 [Tolypocladium ophioglossoides CBS 100239]|uniref:Uncharacterized protein n=1 Tax=Tolypocladium ophioglossoides (strain CBS 100239) TaxID=1163406 RepID=A0A0L0N8E3_TOLOC|nr:hypothetical protein TOPH_04952 [Tolypocladium ophioglossoides CBS 100239]